MRRKRVTQFSLPSYKDFKLVIGQYNALVAFEQVAYFHFLSEKKDDESFNTMIERISREYRIRLTDLSLPNYENVLERSFLNHPHACLEVYLEDFKNDFKKYVDSSFSLVLIDNVSLLDRYLHSLRKVGIIPQISACQMHLFDYYRLIRNSGIHHEKDEKNVEKAYRKAMQYSSEINELYGFLPNSPSKISYTDYILCASNINYIAELLSISVEKHIDWSSIDLFSSDILKQGRLNRFKDSKKRQINYIHGCFQTLFGIKAPIIVLKRVLPN